MSISLCFLWMLLWVIGWVLSQFFSVIYYLNAEGHRIGSVGNLIAKVIDVAVNAEISENVENVRAVHGITLWDSNRNDQFYANSYVIIPPAFQRNDFELKPTYFGIMAHQPFHGLSHEHPMDHLKSFEDLVCSIKLNGVSEDYMLCKLY